MRILNLYTKKISLLKKNTKKNREHLGFFGSNYLKIYLKKNQFKFAFFSPIKLYSSSLSIK